MPYMYHHFSGKADLAHADAIERLAEDLDLELEAALAPGGPGLDRILAYLDRARDVLESDLLREPVAASFARLDDSLARALAEAQEQGELDGSLDPAALAAALAAVVQGGYVLARAGQDPAAFGRAIDGARVKP
jgi:TetR/AcrR family transcriptional repressor of nem operon